MSLKGEEKHDADEHAKDVPLLHLLPLARHLARQVLRMPKHVVQLGPDLQQFGWRWPPEVHSAVVLDAAVRLPLVYAAVELHFLLDEW